MCATPCAVRWTSTLRAAGCGTVAQPATAVARAAAPIAMERCRTVWMARLRTDSVEVPDEVHAVGTRPARLLGDGAEEVAQLVRGSGLVGVVAAPNVDLP